MSKTYIVSRNGGTVTKAPINDNKIPIYANETALDADLNNLPDGTICATSSGHDDVIDQMKEYIRKQNSPDWSNAIDITLSVAGYTFIDDGWLLMDVYAETLGDNLVFVNGLLVGETYGNSSFSYGARGLVKVNKGDKATLSSDTAINYQHCKFIPHK